MSVTFNYADWVAQNPALANISEPQATNFFNLATLYFNNLGWPGSLTQAATLLYMLTAHIARLFAPRDALGNPSSAGTFPPPIVGRVSSASQGSISVQTDYDSNSSPSEKWYNQTPEGAAYWAATAQFRTALFIPGPQRARRAAAASYVFPRARGW